MSVIHESKSKQHMKLSERFGAGSWREVDDDVEQGEVKLPLI